MTPPTKLNEKKALTWSLIQNGQLEAARKNCNELCKSNKHDPQCWYLLSVVLSQSHNYPEAIKNYIKTLKLSPNYIEANYNLALAYQLSGLYSNAIKFYRKTIHLNPELADAHFGIGNCLLALGKFQSATEAYKKTLQHRPEYVNAKINLGIAQQRLGKLDDAKSIFLSVAKQDKSADAYLHLGRLYQLTNEGQQAFDSFNKALEIDPNLIAALHELGISFFQSGHLTTAEKYLERILAINSDDISALVTMGSIKTLLGDHDDGLQFAQQALKIDGHNTSAIVLKAKLYEQTDRLDEALQVLQPLIDNQITHAAAGSVFANICLSKKENYKESIAYLNLLLAQGNLNNWDQRQTFFALGKLYDATKQYDNAFSHYKKGNDRKSHEYTPSQNTDHTDHLISTFSKNYYTKLPISTCQIARPIFIVGMPRSGTSLAEQILSRHPAVSGGGELTFMYEITSRISTQHPSLSNYLGGITSTELDVLAKEYLGKTSELHPKTSLLTDKLPANFRSLGLISLLFPSAIIVHCKRNPIDTCLSCYFQDFLGNELSYTNNLEDLAHYYNEYNRLMRHWETALEIPILQVNYEELVENQEKVSRELVAFCELDWDPACLNFNESSRFVRTASYDQVRRPIYKSSVERWRNYERHIASLKHII